MGSGHPDFRGNVDIAQQSLSKLNIDIIAQTLANVSIDIVAQTLANLKVDVNAQTLASVKTDIIAQTLTNLKVDINAQTLGNLAIDIAAQTLGNIGIDIAASSLGNIPINIAAAGMGNIPITLAANTLGNVVIDIAAQTLGDVGMNINSQSLDRVVQRPSFGSTQYIYGSTTVLNGNEDTLFSISATGVLYHAVIYMTGNNVIKDQLLKQVIDTEEQLQVSAHYLYEINRTMSVPQDTSIIEFDMANYEFAIRRSGPFTFESSYAEKFQNNSGASANLYWWVAYAVA